MYLVYNMMCMNWKTCFYCGLIGIAVMRPTGSIAAAAGQSAGWVAFPHRAETASWPRWEKCGSDMHFLLRPVMFDFPELASEPFIRDAGVLSAKWQTSSRNGTPPRVLKIREVEWFAAGRRVDAQVTVSADEPGSEIYRSEAAGDGDPATVCSVSASVATPQTRYREVRAGLTLSAKQAEPVDEIRLSYGDAENPDLAGVTFSADGKAVVPVSQEVDRGRLCHVAKFRGLRAQTLVLTVASAPLTIALADFPKELQPRLHAKPFVSHLMRPVPFGLSPDNYDREACDSLLAEYDGTHLGIAFAEWDSQAFFQSYNRGNRFYADLCSAFGPKPTNRSEYESRLRAFWNWHDAMFFGRAWGMSGGFGCIPYACEYGSKIAGLELTEHTSTIPHRSLLRLTVGAARQYGVPSLLYLAYYLGKYSPDSSRPPAPPDAKGWHSGAGAGISTSFAERMCMIGYFHGVNLFSFEAEPWAQIEKTADGKARLTAQGRTLTKVYGWFRSPAGARGEWYAPILLARDYLHGTTRRNGCVWGYDLKLSDGDWMAERIGRAIDYYDGQAAAWDKPPYSHNLHNSPLGDVFDEAFVNPPSGRYPEFRRYPVVILADEPEISAQLAQRLEDYVVNGGTLVVNSVHRDRLPESFVRGAFKVLSKSKDGGVFARRREFGRGALIVTEPKYLAGADPEQPSDELKGLLMKLQEEVMPFKVTGDVEFAVQNMGQGRWKLLLVNNKGVLKDPWAEKETVDGTYASDVTVDAGAGAEVHEIYAGAKVERTGTCVKLTVPPGGVRVLEIGMPARPAADAPRPIAVWKLAGDARAEPDGRMTGKCFDERWAKDASGLVYYEASHPKTSIGVRANPGYPLLSGSITLWAKPNLGFGGFSDRGGYPFAARFLWIALHEGRWDLVAFDGPRIRGPAAKDGRWTFLAATWTANTVRFYVDGVEFACDGVPLKKFIPIWDGQFELGTKGRGRRTFGGGISTVRLYAGELSSEEVKARYLAEIKEVR